MDFLDFLSDLLDLLPTRIAVAIALGCLVGYVTYALGYADVAPQLGVGTAIALTAFAVWMMPDADSS
jgi:heme O synthase-like polyprenyltransferase